MEIRFIKLTEPTVDIANILDRWENDPSLIPLIRLNRDQAALQQKRTITVDELDRRLSNHQVYLIYLGDKLVGEMDYQIDPPILYKKETGTAWIGIVIGEEIARGRGVGFQALQFLEQEIKAQGLKRIELGVFEFNSNAIRLYKKLGYQKIAHIDSFTFWQDRMWQDVRMEKYVQQGMESLP
jgi:RimJ/RimL family protein N-acetyltransferase